MKMVTKIALDEICHKYVHVLPKQHQGAKKIIFAACHSGKLKLAFTSPEVISTSPKNFLTSRIDFDLHSSANQIPQKTSLARWAS